MKSPFCFRHSSFVIRHCGFLLLALPLAALLTQALTATAVTFTSDTAISFNNTNYDDTDIVVTNCTLTVDGPHSFASVQVLNGANLTHSFATNGLLENRRTVTNEQQVLSGTNAATLSNANVVVATIVVQDFSGLVTYTNDVDYALGLDTNGMTTILLTTNSAIAEGSTNLVSYDVLDAPVAAGLSLTVTGDVSVAQGGTINVDAKGYDGALGAGAGRSAGSPLSGSGAGHGGYGGQSAALDGTGPAYGVLAQPVSLGSGGGAGYGGVGGAGGGSVKLVVGGNLRVDGAVSANGANGINNRSGGGSGGSIWLTCSNLSGAGMLSANGGAGEPSQGGGGAGGRISLQFEANTFSGLTPARGGNGYTRGGAGTIYTRANSQPAGQVLVDNGGRTGASTALNPGLSEFFDLTAREGAVIGLTTSRFVGNLLVASNAWISFSNQAVILTATGNATIQAGGGIIADGAGYVGNQGPGAGKYYSYPYDYTGGGGGYGGFGAAGGTTNAYGGITYGSVTAPVDMGSGGGCYPSYGLGGAGGGAIRLNVTGMLVLDGRISADGGVGIGEGSGGGSGGSVWVTAGTLTGAGAISANGGMGNGFGLTGGGGGGGGRIAIQYGMNLFFGVTGARGGGGSAWGGAGTIYTKANSQSWGLVLVDNGGQSGTNTSWSSTSTIDLTVKSGGVVSMPSSQTIGTLLVASNGWLRVINQLLTVTGNATIQAGGGIIADGAGNPSGAGTGAGRYYSGSYGVIGGGGGYGGYGAAGSLSSGYSAYGGSTYGSLTAPIDLGSGGGGYSYPTSGVSAPGGAGGGAIRLNVTGVLQVDGRISAAGAQGTAPSAGGGSGGTVSLAAGTLSGSGIISANGGAGSALGGGGGGGRIAVVYTANTFSGLVSAYGGGGYAWGGAGTVYTKANSQSWGLVTLDNGGQSGTNTSVTWGGTSDLTVKGGAVVTLTSYYSQIVGTLLVASNGWVALSSSQGYSSMLTVTGNATIQAGGGIIADGTGYAAGLGAGAGGYAYISGGWVGGGGGYGGNGAASGGSPAARGGNGSGTVTATAAGSGGGSYPNYLVSGPGGGDIALNVTGTLLVDGRISAAGGAGVSANAGGGSGGGISLTVGTLSGSGVIAANGGAGSGLGGGGGGGRIAINYTTSAFSGVLSAYGGGGYAWGGAGTIYTKANNRAWGQVLVDNGGRAGANTSWLPTVTIDLTVMGGAVVTPPSPQILGNLLVASNGWISVSTQTLTLTVTSNATVQGGGGILADGTGTGYAGGQGPGGAGRYAYSSSSGYVGGGGGHGGYGSASGGATPAFGGSTYGSVTAPVDRGSGGGNYSSSAPGGAGGGAIRMNVTGALLINGRISASGGAGVGQGTGGGSGGSVWLTAGTLAGAGTISANGGAGNELGGGGGGGCIALQYGVNAFEGIVSAYGGGGYAWGGAGTIYTKANSQNMGQMLVDNSGHSGTNTPVAFLLPFDLTVRGGAVAHPSSPYLILSNLFINSGGSFTCLPTQTNLDVAVLRNATIDAGGLMSVDGKGFGLGVGPGTGLSTNSIGSGAGYGGNGGASSLLPGGETYGSAQQPVDRGSGGGLGWGAATGGAEGGGAIRFAVGGALTVHGRLSAGGNAALQDDGGGGSGGSIWLTAGALAGSGAIAADGGAGELYDGGGGGGGRIAIYTPVNAFAGLVSAAGGYGVSPGQNGSIYYATTPAPPQVVSTTPTGALNSAVSSFDILFSTVVNPTSVSAATVALTAPGGLVVSSLAVSAVSPYLFRVSFPQQVAQGDYVTTVGPHVLDLLGQQMSQVYTGAFSIVWNLVEGAVSDTNGLPVPGVVLQPDGGVPAATTDTNGNYALAVPPVGTVTVVPSKSGLMFVPASRAYANVTRWSISDQNYVAVATTVPTITTRVQLNALYLNWYGIYGITYQLLSSTNLVDWRPAATYLPTSNGPLQWIVPMDQNAMMFFRVGGTY
jgi:hypothetical protein